MTTEKFDAIVVGAGHAGIEACLSIARAGYRTLLLTMDLDTIGKMSCNPAIGGIAKGHIVREIDALGGQMGKTTDEVALQFRMLNRSKGPAVWAPRAQCDKMRYARRMKMICEDEPNLMIKQELVEEILTDDGKVTGVATQAQNQYLSDYLILTTGTFLRGKVHMGLVNYEGGRNGELSANKLTHSITKYGIETARFKTGTPPRVNKNSLNFNAMEVQPGDNPPLPFSYSNEKVEYPQMPCYITYTNTKTHEIIRQGLDQSAMYSGNIEGRGPRYCPSIEDKIVRFADKDRHQIFVEPEGWDTNEIYLNGFSSSLPQEIQYEALKTIPGLENVKIMRYAYAIEYDYFPPTQLGMNLETKAIKGLFFAGQINGTTGYEEAGAQGLMVGLNVIRKLRGEEPFILDRSEAYIGILIDDLVTKGTNEPYRMFTSLAEYRLLLRQDNADHRLMKYGHAFGLISDAQYQALQAKEKEIDELTTYLKKTYHENKSLAKLLCRQQMTYDDLPKKKESSQPVIFQTELNIKYEHYIKRQMSQVQEFKKAERMKIPTNFDFSTLTGVRQEVIDKLSDIKPTSIGQASRIPGISQDALSLVVLQIKKWSAEEQQPEMV